MNSDNEKVYLDYAASTPVKDEVVQSMEPYWQDVFANPQSTHRQGRRAHQAIEQAREQIAELLSVQPHELVFTSGATEANTLAIRGRCSQSDGKNSKHKKAQYAAAISAGSHPSLLSAKKENFSVQTLPLKSSGRIDKSEIQNQVNSKTSVVSVPYVNSSVGAIEPLHEISNELNSLEITGDESVVFHTDASQAGCYQTLRPETLGVDMMTVNSQKIYGPKGVGLLWVRSGISLSPTFMSDTNYVVADYQKIRPGTPPVPLIVGFAKALKLSQENYSENRNNVLKVRNYALSELDKMPADFVLNGPREGRVANNIHISFPGKNHDLLVTKLDTLGVAVSASTACQSQSEESQILAGVPEAFDAGIRITLGLDTTQADIDELIDQLTHNVL